MHDVNWFRQFCKGWRRENISRICLLGSLFIFAFAACILSITATGFMFKMVLAKWQIVLSLLVTFLIQYHFTKSYFPKQRFKVFMAITAVFLAMLVISILIVNNFYDLSWDGQTYHQEAIIQLHNGWNPFFQTLPKDVPYSIWTEHYPKAGEILAASLYIVTGNIESGKAFNLLFIVASFLIALSLLLSLKKIHIVIAILSSLIIAMNPISVCQLMTFYIDGLLGSVIASFIAVTVLIYLQSNRVLLGMYFALLLIFINLKPTAFIYAIIFILALMLLLYFYKKRKTLKKVFIVTTIGFLFGTILIGFNPFITNTVDHKHPFYPILGPEKIDIGIASLTPGYFLKMDRFRKLFYSNFAHSENNWGPNAKLKLKIPFSDSNENHWFAAADVRTGGFGPLFSGIVTLFWILTVGSLICLIRNQGMKELKLVFYIMVVIFISVIVNPETWWARYIPQLWYIPICIIPLLTYQRHPALRVGNYLLIGVFLFNINIIASVNFQANLKDTRALNNQLKKIAAQHRVVDACFGDFYSNRIRFEKMGIQYREFKDEKELESKGKTKIVIWPNVKVGVPLE